MTDLELLKQMFERSGLEIRTSSISTYVPESRIIDYQGQKLVVTERIVEQVQMEFEEDQYRTIAFQFDSKSGELAKVVTIDEEY